MSDLEARLLAVRSSGNDEELADLLIVYAADRLGAGALPDALRALDEALLIYIAAGRRADQARSLHMSATICRTLGRLDDAIERARRAEALADDATPAKVAAIMEQGEVAVLRADYAEAADHYQRALQQGRAAGLLHDHQARLLRKRGKMLAAAGNFVDAAIDISDGRELHVRTGTLDEARRAIVELAVVHEQAGKFERMKKMIELSRAEAKAAGDDHVAADIELLAAGRAAAEGDLASALESARRARKHALDAPAPLSYVSAVMTIAEISDAMGDRASAYEALASGWVTAGDVMGAEAAKQLFEPRLEALRVSWGAQAFLAVRDAYNDRRRAELLRGGKA